VLICDPKEVFLILVFFFGWGDPMLIECQNFLIQVFLSLEVLDFIAELGVELPLDMF
jgi:hypothetical protein